jgi:hypothetical protein
MARPSNWNHLGGTPKVGTTWGCRGGLKGGDSRGGWAGNSSLSLLRRSLSSACGSVWRVSWISRPFGGRNLDVDQLQGGELLQDASWAEARGERGQPSCQRHRDRRQDLMAPSNPSSTTSSIGSPRPTAPRTRPRSAIPTSAGRATTIRRSHPGPPRPQCAPHRANRREPAPRPRQTAQNGLTQNHVR